MKYRILIVSFLIFGLSFPSNRVYSQKNNDGLQLVHPGTDSVYFSYKEKPLLSFGSMSDFIDYGSLKFKGHFFISSLGHNLVLSSPKEIIVYVSSPTGMENYYYTKGAQCRLTDLPFPDGVYEARFFDPKTGFTDTREIRIRSGDGRLQTPPFYDDYAIHIVFK